MTTLSADFSPTYPTIPHMLRESSAGRSRPGSPRCVDEATPGATRACGTMPRMASAVPDRAPTPDRDSSPYVELDRSAWSALGAATEQPLNRDEVERVRGLGD